MLRYGGPHYRIWPSCNKQLDDGAVGRPRGLGAGVGDIMFFNSKQHSYHLVTPAHGHNARGHIGGVTLAWQPRCIFFLWAAGGHI
jgi:hypothetical protein